MSFNPNKERRQMYAVLGGLGFAGALALGAVAYAENRTDGVSGSLDPVAVEAAMKARLPETKISKVDCAKLSGICEVTSGPRIFYTDAKARYLVVGRVYDMETRQDLTAARLLELSPDTLVAGAAKSAEGEIGAGEAPAPSQPARARNVDLSKLPASGAIRWGSKSGPKLVLFTDLNCSYCRLTAGVLKKLDIQVEERPISVLGTRPLSEAVYCAKDPVAALHAAYEGAGPKGAGKKCDTSGLDANEAFAQANGFNGTPVIVRASDGAVLDGYRAGPVLLAFAKGGAN